MIRTCCLPLLVLSLIALNFRTIDGADVFKKTVTGKPAIKSMNAISFAPEGVLLIGDGTGSQIFAIRTKDVSKHDAFMGKIEGIDAKLAGHFGAKANGIEILDLSVNPASSKSRSKSDFE